MRCVIVVVEKYNGKVDLIGRVVKDSFQCKHQVAKKVSCLAGDYKESGLVVRHFFFTCQLLLEDGHKTETCSGY
jgi:hypothetical protein